MRTRADWDAEIQRDAEWRQVAVQFDMALSASPVPWVFTAWCCVCVAARPMRISWETAVISADGAVAPDWSATPTCEGCGFGSATRALVRFVRDRRRDGESIEVAGTEGTFRHELLMRALGTTEAALDDGCVEAGWLVDCGALARSDDPAGLAARWRERLHRGARLVVASPFDASLDAAHAVHHGAGGPRRRVGWGVLQVLREAGFAEVVVHRAWSPWNGHIGVPAVIEAAT